MQLWFQEDDLLQKLVQCDRMKGDNSNGKVGDDVINYSEKLRELKNILREKEALALDLRAKRDELNNEVKVLSLKIREKREILSEYRTKISEIIEEKNKLIEEIRRLKEEKMKITEKLSNLRALFREKRGKMRNLRTLIGRRLPSEEILAEKLEKLEWEYQTKSMSLEEEKIYIERIEKIGKMLANLRKYNKFREEIEKIREEISSLTALRKEIIEKMNEYSNKYLSLKEELKKLREVRDQLKAEIEQMVNQREEKRSIANEYHQKFIETSNEIRRLQDEIERIAILLKASQLSRIIEERKKNLYSKAKEVYEKYKRGEKLTFEEFKLLIEFNMIKP